MKSWFLTLVLTLAFSPKSDACVVGLPGSVLIEHSDDTGLVTKLVSGAGDPAVTGQ